jgi:hypothetical protein
MTPRVRAALGWLAYTLMMGVIIVATRWHPFPSPVETVLVITGLIVSVAYLARRWRP